MILEIQHETQLNYTEPVSEWLTELRMQPVSNELQSCHSFFLNVSQPTSLCSYLDGFGNRVHHFNLLTPHQQVRVLAASVVETSSAVVDLSVPAAEFPVDLSQGGCELHHFLSFGGPVSDCPSLKPLLEQLAPQTGERIGLWIQRVGDYIHSNYEYARFVTDSASPIDDILSHGKGVCQDFAHLMIAVLRSYGVPARYVSGYIHRPNKESQSHAWCEAWIPGLGWIGYDPTNACPVNEHFVRVAIGRDYTDVPPNKGIFRGRGEESISVRVATRELNRLPSVSWQEHLPPIDVPLTPLLDPHTFLYTDDQQQQQQQQQQESHQDQQQQQQQQQ